MTTLSIRIVQTPPATGELFLAYPYNANKKEIAVFEYKFTSFENFDQPHENCHGNGYSYQYNMALNRFNTAVRNGKMTRLKNRLMHCQHWLYDLNTLKSKLSVRGSFYAGLQIVPIYSIIGSEGKINDFDKGFHPLRETSRERWVSMAMAYMNYLPLPPVELIQIDDVYFVRDGHHRISVSQAFGQISIDAEVIIWQATPPFPWQPKAVLESSLGIKRLNPST